MCGGGWVGGGLLAATIGAGTTRGVNAVVAGWVHVGDDGVNGCLVVG